MNTYQAGIHARAKDVARELKEAFAALLESLPGNPRRPKHIATCLGANPNLAHRLCTALRKDDPFEVLLAMPGTNPLTLLVHEAEGRGVAAGLCEQAREAVQVFESLIRSIGNDRTTFDAVISEWVPSARSQIDATARQSVYRGLRQIRGISAATYGFTAIMCPSEKDTARLDVLTIACNIGIERLRSNGRLVLSDEAHLVGNASAADPKLRVLDEYSSDPTPIIRAMRSGSVARYVMEWNHVMGGDSPRDVVLSCLLRGGFVRRRADPSAPLGGITTRPIVPSRRMIFDLILHREALTDCIPIHRVYALRSSGINSPNNPLDEVNIIPHGAEVQSVRIGGVHELATPEMPFYHGMLASQCAALGWNIEDFRGFRVRTDYPLLDADSQLVVSLPAAI